MLLAQGMNGFNTIFYYQPATKTSTATTSSTNTSTIITTTISVVDQAGTECMEKLAPPSHGKAMRCEDLGVCCCCGEGVNDDDVSLKNTSTSCHVDHNTTDFECSAVILVACDDCDCDPKNKNCDDKCTLSPKP